jgi:ADP-ribosylation factor GTPase-activating protein 2/3
MRVFLLLIERQLTESSVEETSTAARDRFGGQRAISSDMYFERGSYDPAAAAEAQERLRSFQGASAISSNAYFGREEEEGGEGGGGGGEGMMGDTSLAGLQDCAREATQRVLAKPTVRNDAESIRQGAYKVRRVPLTGVCADADERASYQITSLYSLTAERARF